MSLPEVTVVVTCFNYNLWLHRCLRSLLNQQYISPEQYEIVFVDDGSTDASIAVALHYSNRFPNFQILSNAQNRGLPFSCNKAIEASYGRYVVRVDADDYVARNFLYLGCQFLEKNRQYQAVACDYVEVDEGENTIRRVNCFEEEIACGIFFRREYIYDIGLYDIEFKMREGHELRIRFTQKYKMARLEFPVYKYRKHSENRSKNQNEVAKFDEKLKTKGGE